MIVVRNVFRLKFGQAKPALEAWKEGAAVMKKLGFSSQNRMLTDLVGPSYTLVFENTFQSLTDFEAESKKIMGKPEWRAWYDKFIPHCEQGYREIFNVIE
jgi:hypothetical protein